MKVYLVGGAVRDELLGLDDFDKDFVVVDSSSSEMINAGFKQVGKDFPVFLHPKTKEEYALARRERKSGQGYTGFEMDIEDVSLSEDLERRDLTINAMAKDLTSGEIIDPFGGQEDLAQGLLRHITPAFSEDPVRVLRIARFAARFKPFGFKVANSTYQLLKQMVASGEVDCLVPERVWAEIDKALSYQTPSVFFKVLNTCGALAIILPDLEKQINHHENPFIFLDNLATDNTTIKWALVCQYLDTQQTKTLCQSIKCTNKHKELALLTVKWLPFVKGDHHINVKHRPQGDFSSFALLFKTCINLAKNGFIKITNWAKLDIYPIPNPNAEVSKGNLIAHNTQDWWDFYHQTDALRRVDRFEELLLVFQTLGVEIDLIKTLQQQLQSIDISTLKTDDIASALLTKRLAVIDSGLTTYFIHNTHNKGHCEG